jgi:1-deoxy-D-xylulose 5-phosphate reductoisomerase
VAAFLEGAIQFLDIPRVIEQTLQETEDRHPESISQVLLEDSQARRVAAEMVNHVSKTKVTSPSAALAR